ncbi:MAG TPA: hypothetical protein VNT81_18540 [Vicinamibacterales bacterium]|nr:hypothetical protein [Vicinamibacterales bacterium]
MKVPREVIDMNPYAIADLASGSADAASLRARLQAWHDQMVAHERRLRTDPDAGPCDDECPHVEATVLWREAAALLGARARDLTFLRSRALGAGTSPNRER